MRIIKMILMNKKYMAQLIPKIHNIGVEADY